MNRLYISITVIVWLLCICLYVDIAAAWTAKAHFDAPSDPTWQTVVLVSEISGEYGESWGARSEPGADTVDIGNIKPSTQYYAVAYRVNPATWDKSVYSKEYSFLTKANVAKTIYELPELPLSGVSITLTVETLP